MTVATETASAKRPGAWQRHAPYAAPALILLGVIVPFLRYHEYDLLLPESMILMAGAVGIGIGAGVLSRMSPNVLGPSVTALFLYIFALYQPAVTDQVLAVGGVIARWTGDGRLGLALALIGLFVGVFLICWLFRQHLVLIVVAVFGVMVASSLALPPSEGGKTAETGALPANLRDLPPIIHVVLDEHIGLAGLPPELKEGATARQAILSAYEDFALYSRAYSRFAETHFSLASLMNNEHGVDAATLLNTKPIGHVVRRNGWFERLKEMGYAVKVYQTDWLDLCSGSQAIDACYTYAIYSLNSVQRSALSTEARLRLLLGKLHLGAPVALLGPLAAGEAFDQFQSDIAASPRGVAYIVHLLLPHYGYLYRSDCSLADPREWEDQPVDAEMTYSPAERRRIYDLYLPQLVCTEQRMRRLLDDLKGLGIYDDATIIVHGDHGSRIGQRTIHAPAEAMTDRDLLDHHSTLLAVKAPGVGPGLREEPVSVQEIFADFFLGGVEGEPIPPGQVFVRNEEREIFVPRTLAWPGEASQPRGDSLAATRHVSDLPATE